VIDWPTTTADLRGVGLDDHEARRLAAEGRANVASEDSSRSVTEILRANIFTRFDAILGTMLVVIVAVWNQIAGSITKEFRLNRQNAT